MNIIHFTLGSVNPDSANGVNRVIEGLARTINSSEAHSVSVVTVRRKLKVEKRAFIQRDGFIVITCCSTREALRYLGEKRGETDLVHLHNAWSITNIVVGRWLFRNGIPYVITPHAAFLPDRISNRQWLRARFHRLFQKRLLDRAALLIAVSRDEIASIVPFVSNERLVFVPNGTISLANPAHKRNSDNGPRNAKLRFGYLGRISREKNILALVRSVEMLRPEVQDQISVDIYGDYQNDYGRDCLRLVERLGLQSLITFHGAVSSAQKWKRLRAMDVYIQPSLSEAASISVLEAISQSLPLVATRTSGLSYWYGNEFLSMVEPIPTEIAGGIAEMVNKRAQLDTLGMAARAFFDANFTWEVVAQRLLDQYRECLTKDPADEIGATIR